MQLLDLNCWWKMILKKKKIVDGKCEEIRVGEIKNGFGQVKKVLNKFVLQSKQLNCLSEHIP